jgi:hypothetical protein
MRTMEPAKLVSSDGQRHDGEPDLAPEAARSWRVVEHVPHCPCNGVLLMALETKRPERALRAGRRGRIRAVDRLSFAPDGLAELVHGLLEGAVGGWSMGVQGALAEFAVVGADPAAVTVRRSGRTVEALTGAGGIRLTVTDATQVLADGGTLYLVVPRRTLPVPAGGLTFTEADPGALRPEDSHDLFVDLAIGHAAATFCVRTADADLAKRLRAIEGAAWPDALASVGHALVIASPHRIVTTPLGRIEVYAAIPSDAGASPEGPHTHLLPPLLRTGRELPTPIALPPDLAPAAAFHPPPGWTGAT